MTIETTLPTQHEQTGRDFPWMVVYIWLGLVVFTRMLAMLISPLRPLTVLEQAIPVWPPSQPWVTWLRRMLLAPLQRWDVQYYIWIADRGYHLGDGTTQFHPLFPGFARLLAEIGIDPLLALSIVSTLATWVLLAVFYRLARLDYHPQSARIGTLLLLCSPYAFVFFVPYSESVFLVWAVLCLYWARRKLWWWAGLAGAFAALTRQQGIFLLLPLAWELWADSKCDWRKALLAIKNWMALLLIPGGYGVWLVYRAVSLGDFDPNFASLNQMIYSFLISPDAAYVVPQQTFMWPWQAFGLACSHLWHKPDADIIINFIFGGYFLLLLALSWKQLTISYRIYTLVNTLISFGYHTGPAHPYMGLPRHLLLGFPVFLGLTAPARRRWLRWTLLTFGFLGMVLLLLVYVLEAWIP